MSTESLDAADRAVHRRRAISMSRGLSSRSPRTLTRLMEALRLSQARRPPPSCWWLAVASAAAMPAWGQSTNDSGSGDGTAVPLPVSRGPRDNSATTATEVQTIKVEGGRMSDVDERRRSTAAKIIVGREEIERFGDSSVGDILKRLPGVTMGGTPGRGGEIRMRGLGNGYTQILLDGERVQGGLSLDSIDPDQIERIEILRAPTAETGTRAIAGTINIITREGFTKRRNDLRLSAGLENASFQPRASWGREDKWGDLDYNVTLSLFRNERKDSSTVNTVNSTDDRTEDKHSESTRNGAHLGGKLQWRLEDGASLMLMPMIVYSSGTTNGETAFESGSKGTLPYTNSDSHASSSFSLTRVNGQWKSRLGEGRVEVKGGWGLSRNFSHTLRTEFNSDEGGDLDYDDRSLGVEHTGSLNGKYSLTLENGHSWVSGMEAEHAHRTQETIQLINGVSANDDYGDDYGAKSLRTALYSQDEWNINPNWSAYAGVRWEGIRTQGSNDSGDLPSNRTSVWSPLFHAVFKPDPKGGDQIRLSLTRSYRSPQLGDLLGSTWLAKGTNSPTNPDKSGNANLKPELATGVDLAFERYLANGGMLSANVFVRQIQDLMRTITSQVAQSDGSTRYVSQPQNIGRALTRGIELEAKFRLSDVLESLPAVDVRANGSLFQSRVNSVPGPDNRLDQQAAGTLNLGGDYRWPGTPLTTGGNLNWTPGYRTRLAENQWAVQNAKRVVDAYGAWQFNLNTRVRLTASNMAPRGVDTVSEVSGETATTRAQSYINWQLQLEMKL